MARYLSPEWFSEVAESSEAAPTGSPEMVVEQSVRGGPGGPVTYRVEVNGRHARIRWPVPDGSAPPDLRFTCDWPTAVEIAAGRLSTQRALMQGRLRVSGNPAGVAEVSSRLGGLDPVPAGVRASTTYEA